jgi:uncharacterized BrkB/YihY/UPF0761 family membrane protein
VTRTREQPTNQLSIIAFVLAAVGVLILPIIFGVAGIVLGSMASKRGEPLGPLAFTLSVAGTVVGVVITVLFAVLRFT